MQSFRVAISAALFTFGMSSAHATYMPWQEGLFFPDFDDPSVQGSFHLDSSRIYEWAGGFVGNVGKLGDSSDTINVVWAGLSPGETITSRFQFDGGLAGGGAFGAGQGLQLSMLDVQSNVTISTITLGQGTPWYVDPNLISDNRPYRLTVTPVGLGSAESANYSMSFWLAPVPEPAVSILFSAGLLLLWLGKHRRSR